MMQYTSYLHVSQFPMMHHYSKWMCHMTSDDSTTWWQWWDDVQLQEIEVTKFCFLICFLIKIK